MRLYKLKVLNEVKEYLSSEISVLNIQSRRKQKIVKKQALSILNSSDPKDIHIFYAERAGKYVISVVNWKYHWMKLYLIYDPFFKPDSEVYIKDIKF